MRLVLINDDKELEINLPDEVLSAIWNGETDIVLACTGWSPTHGFLSTATAPHKVTRGKTDVNGDAGMVSIKLSSLVRASEGTLEEHFLPHGTRFKK